MIKSRLFSIIDIWMNELLNNYPLFLISDIIENISIKEIFTKLDL